MSKMADFKALATASLTAGPAEGGAYTAVWEGVTLAVFLADGGTKAARTAALASEFSSLYNVAKQPDEAVLPPPLEDPTDAVES